MQQFTTIILLVFCSSFLLAQNENQKEYLIYLKDGSMYRGIIKKEKLTEKIYEIINNDTTISKFHKRRKTFEIHMEDEIIAKVNQKHIKRITELRPNDYFFKNGRSVRTKGYYFGFNYSLGFGDGGGHTGLNLKLGHYIKPNFVVGLGSGIEFFTGQYNTSINTIPTYAFIRGFPIRKTVSPYYSLEAGWGFGSANKTTYSFFGGTGGSGQLYYKTSYRIKPAIGMRIASRRSSTFTIEAGLNFQNIYIEFEGYDAEIMTNVDSKGNILMTRLTFDFGWMF